MIILAEKGQEHVASSPKNIFLLLWDILKDYFL